MLLSPQWISSSSTTKWYLSLVAKCTYPELCLATYSSIRLIFGGLWFIVILSLVICTDFQFFAPSWTVLFQEPTYEFSEEPLKLALMIRFTSSLFRIIFEVPRLFSELLQAFTLFFVPFWITRESLRTKYTRFCHHTWCQKI